MEGCKNCFTCQLEGKCEKCMTCQLEGVSEDTGCRNCITCQKEAECGPDECQLPNEMSGIPAGGPMGRPPMGQRRPPFEVSSLTVFPTNLCNFTCKYCFIYKYPRKFGESMTMTNKTAHQMVDWLMAASNNPMPGVHWFGGEPLVAYELIKETTEWAVEKYKAVPNKKLHWGLTSNMSLITDEVNEFLRKYDYNVLCSVDGLACDHDKFRVYKDGKGTWSDVIAGFERVMKWKNPGNLTIRWTVHPDTMCSLVDGTKYLFDKGVGAIAHEFVYEVDWTTKKLNEFVRKYDKVIDLVIEYFEKGRVVDVKPLRDGLRSLEPVMRMTDRCGLARGDFGVDVDGNLFSCHRFVDQYDYHLGNVFTGINLQRIQQIQAGWSVDKIRPWNDQVEICLTCPAKMGCNGGCLAVNYDTTGSIYKVPKSYCDIQVMKTKLALGFKSKLQSKGLWERWTQKNRGGQGGQGGQNRWPGI